MTNFFLKTCFAGFLFTFLISCKQDQKKAEIFVNKEVDLGTVSSFDTVHFDIELINPMAEDLIIKKASSSCGCTLVPIKDSIVKPNRKTQLELEFIPSLSGGKGNVSKAVVLETNSPQRFHEIIIKANIE